MPLPRRRQPLAANSSFRDAYNSQAGPLIPPYPHGKATAREECQDFRHFLGLAGPSNQEEHVQKNSCAALSIQMISFKYLNQTNLKIHMSGVDILNLHGRCGLLDWSPVVESLRR